MYQKILVPLDKSKIRCLGSKGTAGRRQTKFVGCPRRGIQSALPLDKCFPNLYYQDNCYKLRIKLCMEG
jgi:hypothetical protein